MAACTGAERAYCAFLFQETQSATIVQRRFCTLYGKDPPSRPTIFILGTKYLLGLAVLLAIPNVWLKLWLNK
ncbi:hypothetical protein C0J52_11225 [Blattella germanica]|nr:hypothetical protein C0J52_11225 [Blattella germanica]